MPTPEKHALLSASGAFRWLHCQRAPRLEEPFPEQSSKYAEAGRVAHAIAELKVRKYFLENMTTRKFNSRAKPFRTDPNYDKGMEAATDMYLDYLKSVAIEYEGPVIPMLETQVNYSKYAPQGSGTADCLMFIPPVLHVTDFKNGVSPVQAEENPQMMLYALGALEDYAAIYGDSIQEVVLTIVQPHAGGVKTWKTSVEYLRTWGEAFVKPAADLAFYGQGEFAPSEDRCHFCRARATCTARAEMYLDLENYKQQKPPLLPDEEVGSILKRAAGLAAWASDLKNYALKAILDGKAIAGFKAVEGRTSREWAGGVDSAFSTMQERGIDEAILWEHRPLTPPALEKALGKKTFESVADLVLKRPGKPTLAPTSDKRKEYNAAEIAFAPVQNTAPEAAATTDEGEVLPF